MLVDKEPAIFVLSGEGGHETQAKRFSDELVNRGYRVILLVEKKSWLIPSISWLTKENRFTLCVAAMIAAAWIPICLLYALFSKDFRCARLLVSFGPMSAVPLTLVAQMISVRSIYIESWSRFEKLSLTCKFHKSLGVNYLVQNPSLLMEDEKDATYFGRLG